jgi:hypothetical protein
LWYKEFVTLVSEQFSTDEFIVDGVYDFTRVFGLPETYNVKRQEKVRVTKYNDKISLSKEFVLRRSSPKKVVAQKVFVQKTDFRLEDSLEWKIFTHPDLPVGDIHKIVLFSVKLLIRELGIENWRELESKANAVRGSNHSLDPNTGIQGKDYTPGVIINWCKAHDEWCTKHGIKYKNYLKNEKVNNEVVVQDDVIIPIINTEPERAQEN